MNGQGSHSSSLKRVSLVCVATLASMVVLGSVWIHLTRVFPGALPPPTGPHPVGKTEFDWQDEARPDPFDGSKNRELDVVVWYPTEHPGTKLAPYVRENWLRQVDRPFPLPKLRHVKTHSWMDVGVAGTHRGWPVVVLGPGFGAFPTDYTSVAEDLASRGYVVTAPAITHCGLDVVFPDGHVAREVEQLPSDDRLAQIWADDIRTVVKRLTQINADEASDFYRKLDLSRVGVLGHSFGGAAAAQFCIAEPICAAAIDMDGALHGDSPTRGVGAPFLMLVSDGTNTFWSSVHAKQDWAKAYHDYLATDRATCARSRLCRMEIKRGFRHMNFTDSAALFRAPLVWIHPALGSADRIDGLRQTRDAIADFLATWLSQEQGCASLSSLRRTKNGVEQE